MKRRGKIRAAAVLTALLAACLLWSGALAETFTGAANGIGEVTVTLTVEDGKMTKSLSLISTCEHPVILNSLDFIRAIRDTLETLL